MNADSNAPAPDSPDTPADAASSAGAANTAAGDTAAGGTAAGGTSPAAGRDPERAGERRDGGGSAGSAGGDGAGRSLSGTRGELLEQIREKAVVHGRVTLSSGAEADFYIDLRRVTLDGQSAPLTGAVMLDTTAHLDFEAVGGLTLGADPVATSMLHAAAARGRRLDAFVVRKAGKAHGLQRRIEGPDIAGRRVLIVEDTSTTGNSPLTAVEAAREAGAEVVAVATIVERGAAGAMAEAGVPYVSAYELADLGLE